MNFLVLMYLVLFSVLLALMAESPTHGFFRSAEMCERKVEIKLLLESCLN